MTTLLTTDPRITGNSIPKIPIQDQQFLFDNASKPEKQVVRDVEYSVYRPQEKPPHILNGEDTLTIRISKNSQHVLLHKGFIRMAVTPTFAVPVAGGSHYTAIAFPGGNQGIVSTVDLKIDNHTVKDSKSDQNILHSIRRLSTARQSNLNYLSDTNFYYSSEFDNEQPGYSLVTNVLEGPKTYKAAVSSVTYAKLNGDGNELNKDAMITIYLHDLIDLWRYHKKVNFGSDIYLRLTLVKLAELFIKSVEPNDLTELAIKDVELWIPTVDPTMKQRTGMIQSITNLERAPHVVEYLHEEIYTKCIQSGCTVAKPLYTIPNNKVKFLLVAIQPEIYRQQQSFDTQQFPGWWGTEGLKSLQINYNGKGILRQRYQLDFKNGTKGWRAYDDFRRFAGKGNSGNLLVNYHDWRTRYTIFAFDLYELGTGGRFKVNNTSNQFELELEFTDNLTQNINVYVTAYSEVTKELVFGTDHMRLRSAKVDN